MTDRGAIEQLKRMIEFDVYSLYEVEALEHGISALQEREERSKWCVYCENGDIKNMLAKIFSTQTVYSFENALGLLNLARGNYDINFCPMCGRPLKGENNETD